MKNFIGLNIKHLCDKNNLKQDEFGQYFDLNKGVVGTYVRGSANPKIETIQRICLHYTISIDDFVNTDLSAGKPYATKGGNLLYTEENKPDPYVISPRYVELLEKSLEDKDKIINALELRLQGDDRSKTA
ncbi:Helix-turn-helix [Flavobacterium gillisiae]|uniref:Helix-turn-helix n=1 Tax=Flavobacterium gillisiae TaxID=150146 RepID=A0A1H3WZ91_9FLAO|nr:helix-turn-helix transcriptional regulator [Flavobacterium gillisiae]SDZ91568.1 Helix-turn-helix [Flavobacterium gillisiae]